MYSITTQKKEEEKNRALNKEDALTNIIEETLQ
jgi:hypothetical protein